MKLRVGVPPRSAGGGDRAAPGENICAVSTLGGDAGRVLGLPDSNWLFSLGRPGTRLGTFALRKESRTDPGHTVGSQVQGQSKTSWQVQGWRKSLDVGQGRETRGKMKRVRVQGQGSEAVVAAEATVIHIQAPSMPFCCFPLDCWPTTRQRHKFWTELVQYKGCSMWKKFSFSWIKSSGFFNLLNWVKLLAFLHMMLR